MTDLLDFYLNVGKAIFQEDMMVFIIGFTIVGFIFKEIVNKIA